MKLHKINKNIFKKINKQKLNSRGNDKEDHSTVKNSKGILRTFTNIRSKLILAFLVPVLFIIFLGFISYSKSSSGLINSYESSTLSNLTNMANNMDFGFSIVSSKANFLNTNKILVNYYSGNYRYSQIEEMSRYMEVQQLITSNILSESYLANIYLLADYGTAISGNGTLSSKLIHEDFLTKGEGAILEEKKASELWIGTHPYLDTQSQTSDDVYAISYIKTLKSTAHKPIGSIVLDVSYDYVYNILSQSGLPEGSVVAFITQDGREIVHGDIAEDFKFFDQKYLADALLADSDDSGLQYVDFNGEEHLFVYSKVDTSNSIICTVIPKSFIVAQADDVKDITFLFVIAASIIAIAFGTFMASDFSKAINKMIKVLLKTASGDLTNTISDRRKDEFHILGNSINDMIESMTGLIQKMAGVGKNVSNSASVVGDSSKNFIRATEEISNSVNDIEQGVTQQATDAENCLHQMSDLAEKINVVYTNTNSIETIAGNTKDIVTDGITILDDLYSKANDTTNITRNVIVDIENLEKESAAIYRIVQTINEIASQTNLLSLNASIEAARAGHAGRGFTVVADEIRKLADESMVASNEIRKIIQRIGDQTKKTVETAKYAESIVLSQEDALNNTVRVFHDINQHVENLTDNLQQIASGIEGIEHAKDDTLSAIESISATAEETAAAASQLGTTAENQLSEVNKLNDVVQQLHNDAINLENTIRIFKINS
ncbi:MAG: HAMP domain-containing protein [Clostridiales bacterium]|nr:HAMP domain-containing protein [Clostridiales bacterium]